MACAVSGKKLGLQGSVRCARGEPGCMQRGTWSEPKRALQVHLHGGATAGGFGAGYGDWDTGYFRKAPRSVGQGEGCLVEVLQ